MDEPQFIVAGQHDTSRRIACLFRPPSRVSAPVLVWFPGFKSDMVSIKATALASWAAHEGSGCLRFDYSGHGQSGGVFEEGTISRWLDEAETVVGRYCADAPLVFVGSSMGAWIALLLGLRLGPPRAFVLIAPAWDMTRLMWERGTDEARQTLLRDGVYLRPSAYGEPYPITRALIEDGRQHCFGDRPIPLDVPVRILHGKRDADIPWRHSLDLMERLTGDDVRLMLVKDGEHRLSRPQDTALLFQLIREFAG